MPQRLVIAHGTDSDWSAATIPLAPGELGYATDTFTLKIGDGNSLWPGLPGIAVGQRSAVAAFIDDSQAADGASGRTDATLSSLAILTLLAANSVNDRAYADQVAKQAGGPRVVPVIQNQDGTWPTTTAGPNDISQWQGTVGFGAAPPAAMNDVVILKDPA